jgi:hypothetical protein
MHLPSTFIAWVACVYMMAHQLMCLLHGHHGYREHHQLMTLLALIALAIAVHAD